MPRGKPVALSNGRGWTKKGDAKDHFSAMLKRHAVGQRVEAAEDHSDLLSLVTAYDNVSPEWHGAKTGGGVDHFIKDHDDEIGRIQFNSKCFFVVRKDGTRVHFSTGKAIDAITAT